ncbi:hypothetical protein E1H18_4789 [Caulobacter sp. RHG1]|nr:hypothetical protein [Caulobacter sp. RHG1]
MSPSPDYPSRTYYLIDYADLRRSQVVYALGPMCYEQAARAAEVALWQTSGVAPAAGERIRVSGPYLVEQGQSREFVVVEPARPRTETVPQ